MRSKATGKLAARRRNNTVVKKKKRWEGKDRSTSSCVSPTTSRSLHLKNTSDWKEGKTESSFEMLLAVKDIWIKRCLI